MQIDFVYDGTSQHVRLHNHVIAPNNGEPPSTCLAANIAAVNQVSNLNVNMSNVVGQPFIYNGRSGRELLRSGGFAIAASGRAVLLHDPRSNLRVREQLACSRSFDLRR
jgi:hypothetical protein